MEEVGRPRAYGPALEKSAQVDREATILFDSNKSKGGLKVEISGQLLSFFFFVFIFFIFVLHLVKHYRTNDQSEAFVE